MKTNRREFVLLGPALLGWSAIGRAGRTGGTLAPIEEPHFPSRLYLCIWRNWELVNADRLAHVLKTSSEHIVEVGGSIGLPTKPVLTQDQLKRIYVTVIRQNWHVLPKSQIAELLDWNQEKLEFMLKEDDFLALKLGPKPVCSRLVYAPPSRAERARASHIAIIVREALGPPIEEPGEPPFHFVRELSDERQVSLRDASAHAAADEVDFSSGWRLAVAEHPMTARTAVRFGSYLENAMGVSLGGHAANVIRLESAGAADGGAAFDIQVSPSELCITGYGDHGLFQALNWVRDQMEKRGGPFLQTGNFSLRDSWNPRYLYSFFALYGDPLAQADIDPFPNGYLDKLARHGINGVWMQAVLRNLAPSRRFPEFGAGSEVRLANLNKLVARAGAFGIKVYLYLNEPRAMPAAFFEKHPEVRGCSEQGTYAMCTSAVEVREWIGESLAHITKQAPGLGGFFTITMSENLTNCFSHGGDWGRGAPNSGNCPRCQKRESWDAIAELIQTFHDGIRRSSNSVDLINWDWGWGDALAEELIPKLPAGSGFLSVSEWDTPVHRGGVNSEVGEYSISVVGPGPRAQRNWALARRRELACLAKVQFNSTWEISAVPYIPVMHLVLRHCENLSKVGIRGLMASWTCGGYPSPNLAGAKAYYLAPRPTREEVLESTAVQRYGPRAAPMIIEAWRRFSDAFEQFPYGVAIYTIPTQHGPANALRFRPTGHPATMILFPQDDLKNWCGAYSPSSALRQFRRMAAGWRNGLAAFRTGLAHVPTAMMPSAEADLAVAETCYNHFASVANQIEFYGLRGRLARTANLKAVLARMRALAKDEIDLAGRQFRIARKHSIIAYEASNHYYYRPLDLVEKILNCRYLIDHEIPARQL